MGKQDSIFFMKGSDNFRPTGEFVYFDPHLDGIMAHRKQRLMDTGVYFISQKWIAIRYRKTKKYALDNSRKPLKLNSDLLSLFSTVLVLCIVALLICCTEIVFTLTILFGNMKRCNFSVISLIFTSYSYSTCACCIGQNVFSHVEIQCNKCVQL